MTDRCQLYLLSPPEIANLDEFFRTLKTILESKIVTVFQLRLKHASEKDILDTGRFLSPILKDHNVAFIVNDDPKIAKKLGADGVHLGRNDVALTDARKMLGEDKIIGITCHNNIDWGIEAAQAGADYVAFGRFYSSRTKESAYRASTEILEFWDRNCTTPCVAIGGITLENAAPLIRSGADFIAISADIWQHDQDLRKHLQNYQKLIEQETKIV